ncbi:MAG: P-loop NTPase fold protein [Solirubrobacteraceae bacterium]
MGRDKLDPVAIGVFGDWGSGKSTVLELIQERLAADEGVVVVYTRPWEYDPNTDPKATLIAEVLEAVQTVVDAQKSLTDKAGERLKNLAKRIQWAKAISLAANTAVTFSPPSFDKIVELFGKKEDGPTEPTLQGFRDEFAALMDDLPEITRVVVLVDDLDRCLPTSVIAALEAIKLFLSVQKMAFVVAADRRLVTLSIATRYGPAPRAEQMAREYLEKIVQIPVSVPALGQADTEAYLALLLLERHFDADPDGLARLVEHCSTRRSAGETRVLDALPDGAIPDGAGADVELAYQLAPILTERMSGNPRRLKRFLNAFWIRSSIAARRSAQLDPPALAKLMVLEELESDQFNTLLDWLGKGELAERLAALENRDAKVPSPDPDAALRPWAQSQPALADLDLGPYLRLAATLRHLPGPGSGLRSDLNALIERLLDQSDAKRKTARNEARELQIEDRLAVARELLDALRSQPGRQADIAETLGELVADEVVANDVGARLREFNPEAVQPALVTRLITKDAHQSIRETVKVWLESGQMEEKAQRATEIVLGLRKTSGSGS